MAGGKFSPVRAPVTIVHSNLDQAVIQITEDRLHLVLKDHLTLAEERKAWIGPLGILIAIITAFVTADFRDFYLKAPVWQAIFLISGVLSFGWLARSIYQSTKAPSLESIIEKIKRSESSGEA